VSAISTQGFLAVRQFRQPPTSAQCVQACVATLLQAGGWAQEAARLHNELVRRMKPDQRGGTKLHEVAQVLRREGLAAFGEPGEEFTDLLGMGIGGVVIGIDPLSLYGPPLSAGSHAVILASEPSTGPGEATIWIGDPHPFAPERSEHSLRHVRSCYERSGRASLFVAHRRFSEMHHDAKTLRAFLARAVATIRADLDRLR